MKLVDIWTTRQKPTLSFELFPARNEKAAQRLEKAIDALASLEPDFVSVTFGAGGSTREGSYQLIEKLTKEKGTMLCVNSDGHMFNEMGSYNLALKFMESYGIESYNIINRTLEKTLAFLGLEE